MEHLDDCSGYFLNCAFHDEDEYRADLSCWYREETFLCVGELLAAELAEEERISAEVDAQWEELLMMHAEDVNVSIDPIDALLDSV